MKFDINYPGESARDKNNSYKKVKLGDALTLVVDNRGKTPPIDGKGSHELIEINAIVGDNKYPNFSVVSKRVSSEVYRTWFRKGRPKPGDVLFSTVGSIAEVAYISQERGCIAQNLVALRPREDLLIGEYLYYLLRSRSVREKIVSLDISSVQPSIKLPHLLAVEIEIPPLEMQRSISSSLGAIDDKIDLNRRINQVLETMAQAIFKSWFVDFDPVKAKIAAIEQGEDPLRAAMRAISGKTDAELDQMPREHHDQLAATAALFPDEMEESELGEIPKGWRVTTIGECFDVTMGQSPPGETYNETGEGIPFYQGRADFTSRFPMERVYCTAPTRLAKKGDVLVSVRAPVGDVNVALNDCAIGRGVAAVRCEHTSFVLYVLRSLNPAFKQYESEGTVFGSINKKQFQALQYVVPLDEVVCKFQSIVQPMDARIESNEIQARTLAILRDALLPRLISGKVWIDSVQEEKHD